jgi:hypothetical protein
MHQLVSVAGLVVHRMVVGATAMAMAGATIMAATVAGMVLAWEISSVGWQLGA